MYGSAASIPVHCHTQIHDYYLPLSDKPAFPLRSCKTEPLGETAPIEETAPTQDTAPNKETAPINKNDNISLFRVIGYPAYALLLKGPWEMIGLWLTTYLASVNTRPHNFILAPEGRLYIIPRSREKAPAQENKYGASEMLGLITPITYDAYEAIDNGSIIADALRICGIENEKEIKSTEEHALWTIKHIRGTYDGEGERRSKNA
jgi:hypothetical protein